jgi:ribonuclease III
MSDDEVALAFGVPAAGAHFLQALTHPSFANELRQAADNQRLEFLGDAVLGLCVAEILWQRLPSAAEGELTRIRAKLVNADALADFARENNVPPALRLGRGAEANGLRNSKNVLADAVEALIAAAYLDVGLPAARAVCNRIVDHGLAGTEAREAEPKTQLQEQAQAAGLGAPVYELLESSGPAHARWFRVQVRSGEVVGEGNGASKRAAERAAAADALRKRSLEATSLPAAGALDSET